jgi:hypothetical protein
MFSDSKKSNRFWIQNSSKTIDQSEQASFCCMGIEEFHKCAGSRGFGIFTKRFDDGEYQFMLQYRAMDNGASAPFTKSPLSLVSEIPLKYCPWCGVNLNEFYKDKLGQMERSDLKL